jgi:putative tryptophan/tyrosine transport system substrate-binding protein
MMDYKVIILRLLGTLFLLGLLADTSVAADVVIVADTQIKPVVQLISGIRKTLEASLKVYTPAEVRGRLKSIVDKEGARVVIALGREALDDALRLPPGIPVIYDLVVIPPQISRPNTAGFYMATPAREYVDLLKEYLQSIRKIAVIGSRDQLNILARDDSHQMVSYSVKNSVEFVNTVKQLDNADAILLLPDTTLLTAAALEEAYLLSFRKGIPLLGISEKHVKQGALLALVVDLVSVGKRIGEYASKAIKGTDVGQFSSSPPKIFELYLNTDTARKMGIHLPDNLIRSAKRSYP